MSALVLYATRHGTTQRVAEAIADGIRAHDIADVRSVAEAEPLSEAVTVTLRCQVWPSVSFTTMATCSPGCQLVPVSVTWLPGG